MQDKRIIVLVSLALLVAITLAGSHAKTFQEKWLEWGKEDCNGDASCIPEELVPYDDEVLNRRYCPYDFIKPELIFRELREVDVDFCDLTPEFDPDRSECALPGEYT
jgi:hypothetical protein